MIILDVHEYCHDCPGFTVDTKVHSHAYNDEGRVVGTNFVVVCTYYRRCESMMNYLKKHHEEKEKKS